LFPEALIFLYGVAGFEVVIFNGLVRGLSSSDVESLDVSLSLESAVSLDLAASAPSLTVSPPFSSIMAGSLSKETIFNDWDLGLKDRSLSSVWIPYAPDKDVDEFCNVFRRVSGSSLVTPTGTSPENSLG
jgi:hypothetical protein